MKNNTTNHLLATAAASVFSQTYFHGTKADLSPGDVVVLRGEGKGFSAGGDFGLVEDMARDFAVRTFGLPDVSGFLGVCFGRVVTANSPATSKALCFVVIIFALRIARKTSLQRLWQPS